MTAPELLYRGLVGGALLAELARTAPTVAAAGSLLHGRFATFDEWNEIDSWFEGRFLERNAKGAYAASMKAHRDAIKVQFDHGYDSFVGSAPLGPIDELREDDQGAYYEVPLLDTDYNRDRILPLLQGRTIDGRDTGSLLGASYRFRVTREEWVEPKAATAYNPEKLPERTILEVRLFEFGPVVFPASLSASAKVRSLTDHYRDLERARHPRPVDAPGGMSREAAVTAVLALRGRS